MFLHFIPHPDSLTVFLCIFFNIKNYANCLLEILIVFFKIYEFILQVYL